MISECASYTNTPSAGIDMMEEVDVVGVMCHEVQPLSTPAVASSQQMLTMILQSTVVTAAFIGFIFLILLLLLGR